MNYALRYVWFYLTGQTRRLGGLRAARSRRLNRAAKAQMTTTPRSATTDAQTETRSVVVAAAEQQPKDSGQARPSQSPASAGVIVATAADRGVRRVVCSAARYGRMVIAGVRHFDEVMARTAEVVDPARIFDWEQGFLDNRSVYMSRAEALEVAKAAGQIIKKHGRANELYSEDFIPGYIP